MEITVPLSEGLQLKIADSADSDKEYPSSYLQKAFLLSHNGQSLAQEAVGFGFPIIKLGLTAIFPGSVEVTSRQRGADWKVTAVYSLRLKEKIAGPGRDRIRNEMVYAAKNFMAFLIRRLPLFRSVLTGASSMLRWLFGWKTVYDDAGFRVKVKVMYTILAEKGKILVDVDWTGRTESGVTEVIIMNEQGARYFDQYGDSSGIFLQGKEIGCWDEVFADEASFMSSKSRIVFSLSRLSVARLFRGRELVGSRLSWAGFGYSVKPNVNKFSYVVRIGKCP